ncbi:MAG: hypothetical protein ABUL77_03735 [Bacteroidota bacterium]
MTGEDEDLGMTAGKRLGPEEVPPVTIGQTRFEVVHWGRQRGLGQNGGYIAAIDVPSGKELWTLKVYEVKYDPDMEEDVQDVFIESLAPRGDDRLAIVDERGRKYIVEPRQRQVRSE